MASLAPALVFIGFMGAGKSAAAREAAAGLGTEPVDIDMLLERELGTTIADFFERRGEAEFRVREEALATAMLERADGGVVALGGGALGSERVRNALARHTVVLLEIDPATAWTRVGDGDRPLARDRDHFEALYAERLPVYERAADAILPSGLGVVTQALGPLRALARAPEGVRMLWARSASGDYPVYAGPGLLRSGFWPLEGRRFCVTDANVNRLHGPAVEPLAGTVVVEPGEVSKTPASAERVWRSLAQQGMTRDDHLVALGGGMVGDLAGFCAATYQRGVALVQVPTTLVAQVDSAYGGKTGVDLPEAKNYVGAYHQPAAVMVDPASLLTLPDEELAAGYAEVVKTALIAGGSLWERVREGAGGAAQPDVILACARTKLAVVAQDERDAGRRQVLNLGHTVGHAIETATGYERYRHGEAVALGLLAALRLSGQDALLSEVSSLLEQHGLPTRLDGVDPQDVVAAVSRDKKRRANGTVAFVLLDAPGRARTGCAVSEADLLGAVRELVEP
ncbi:MAG TPA: iron-containing alcohol dehydrogenase [Solirubrobacteraceae bacterium]|nr:iron-containing alcohol dehydrogenase [Solirubrobacteraceae bacterium]